MTRTSFDPSATFAVLYEDLKSGFKCDMLVFGEGRQEGIPCQSSVLNAISGYFRAYFARWASRKNLNIPIEVHLDEIPTEVMKQ